MATKVSAAEFWTHNYVKGLPPFGKFCLYYALSFEYDGKKIIIEDMASSTGLDNSVCGDWLQHFISDGMIERNLVLDTVL